MKEKVFEVVVGVLTDLIAYWIPFFLVGILFFSQADVFSLEQRDLILTGFFVLSLWRYWDGSYKERQLDYLLRILTSLKDTEQEKKKKP